VKATRDERGPAGRRRGRVAAACLLAATLAAHAPAASAPTEQEVKAAFLYNFAKFVEWPPNTRSAPGPFVIAVLGPDPFGPTLDQVLAGKAVAGRPVEVRRCAEAAEARGAHIVYVAPREGGPAVLRAVSGEGVLTVGDGEAFARAGGIIGFRLQDRKVRFDINARQAERAGLKLSSQLLKLARIVDGAD
jgi:hypothetical protein